jgi:hypothetical protein
LERQEEEAAEEEDDSDEEGFECLQVSKRMSRRIVGTAIQFLCGDKRRSRRRKKQDVPRCKRDWREQ